MMLLLFFVDKLFSLTLTKTFIYKKESRKRSLIFKHFSYNIKARENNENQLTNLKIFMFTEYP